MEKFAQADPLGERLFVQACAGCHLTSGDGRQSPWAALECAHTVGDTTGTNLIQALTSSTQMTTVRGIVYMHPFLSAFDDKLAAMANYTISQFCFR
jgi:mono/diheme cytochrome c family protein